MTPGAPGGWVVVAREADGEREQVRPLEREVRGVEGTEARTRGDDVAAGLVLDERHDLIEDPRLVAAVLARPVLQRELAVRPRRRVERVHAVELHPAGVDQIGDRAD